MMLQLNHLTQFSIYVHISGKNYPNKERDAHIDIDEWVWYEWVFSIELFDSLSDI